MPNYRCEWARLTLHEDVVSDEIEKVVTAIQQVGHSAALLARLREQEAAREEIKAQLGEVESRIADVLTNRVQETTGQLADMAKADLRDVPAINATMRQLFDKVEVDWPQGQLWFHWKHAPGGNDRDHVRALAEG